MIASIDNQLDITVFLSSEEVKKLGSASLEGVLVKQHKPKQQGTIVVSVNDKVKNKYDTSGVGVVFTGYDWKNVGKVELFLRSEFYAPLLVNGKNGVRYGTSGSKVHVYDRSRADFLTNSAAEHLEFYRDNKDKLLPELG